MFRKFNSIKWIPSIVSKIKKLFLPKNLIQLKNMYMKVLISVSLIKKIDL